jgi:ABC-type glycerol-3-phosphate transport system substrate-binding protein
MRQSLSRLSILALVLLVAAVGMVSAEGPVIRWSGFYEFNKNATPETLVMKWVGEATGTTLQPMHVEQGDMSTWWSTTLASLDFPDVMQYFGTMGDDPNIYGPQGLFVALDVEREAGNMPNLDRVFTAWDADNYQRFAPDGHVYLANRLDTRFLTPRVPGFVLRSDLMEAAGYDPSVPDQFTDVDQVQEAILAMKPHWDAMFGGPTTGMHTRGDRGIRSGGQLPRVMYKDEFAADTAMQMEPTIIEPRTTSGASGR